MISTFGPLVAETITPGGFSREDCYRFGAENQKRVEEAINDGRFINSVVPIYNEDGSLALDHDEFPRPGRAMEDLAGGKKKPRLA